ncbi:MAG: hypothetical protein P1U89_24360 [Verrucomicrobiales bacterium]|nr:hypothetical protein [Verrucomicrobiales bacterium]
MLAKPLKDTAVDARFDYIVKPAFGVKSLWKQLFGCIRSFYNHLTTVILYSVRVDCMKRFIAISCALVSAIIGSRTSFAGGRAVEFESHGVPLLEQAPALVGVLGGHFTVENSGLLGPGDAPFDGSRLYTYMDFRARSKGGDGQIFLIRLHFDRGERPVNYTRLSFKRMEIFSVPASAEAKLKTFRDLYEATGANQTE